MIQPSRFIKRLIAPALLVAALVAAAVVFAQPPVAGFDVTAPAGNTCGVYNFTSSSLDPDNDIQSWTWNVAGNTSSGLTAQATWNTTGTRNVTLTVKDAAGGDDTTEDEA
ncbi:MAG: hypothetical protein QOE60_133, partial [Thermoleophilaceae bacterium]|nr:hypothetical protein [Thermoleophilaceae bacterium]